IERAIKQLVKDGVLEIVKLGVGSETTRYAVRMDKFSRTKILAAEELGGTEAGPLVGREEAQAGGSEDPGVGRETASKRGIGIGELNPEDKPGKSFSLSSGVDSPLEPDKPKANPQTSGTTVPEPRSGTSRPETHGGFVPQECPPVPPSPRKENPRDIWE